MNIPEYVSKFVNGTNHPVFLTGKAGTGKTTLLKQIVGSTHKKTVIAAPTGIAAINAGGVTLHSLFHLPFGAYIPENNIPFNLDFSFQLTTPNMLIKNLKMNTHKRNLLREMELLIIDEVSMLRADLADAIDYILRYVRRNNKPFGGLQVLFIGDLWQLPPVVKQEEWEVLKNYYSSSFFFNAQVFKSLDLIYLELDKIYRQADTEFIELLNRFRLNTVNTEDINLLNQRYVKDFNLLENEGYIYLTTHNHKAESVNKEALKKLPGKTYRFDAEITGDFGEYLYPVDFTLELKKGAQVMFIKNDYSGRQAYFNGKIGVIEHINDEEIHVGFLDGSPSAIVEPYIWENKKFTLHPETHEIEERIDGTFAHYPIKLAWAITIHKSQGLTFDKAMIDISQVFAAGQTYVALSRLTSLKGLVLAKPVTWQGPQTDQFLFDFAQTKSSADEAEKRFKQASQEYLFENAIHAFNFDSLAHEIKEHLASYNKELSKSAKQKYLGWASTLQNNFQEIESVAEKFRVQLAKIINQPAENHSEKLRGRLVAAKEYFEPLLSAQQKEIGLHIESVKKVKGTKKYVNELKQLQAVFFQQVVKIYKTEALCLAVMNETELDKSAVLKIKSSIKPAEIEKSETQSAGKGEKVKSEQITYNLFREGKSLPEIAAERGMVVQTIETHLGKCVEQGLINVLELITPERKEAILEAIKILETKLLTPLKEYLGESYSYNEIRYVLQWLKYKKKQT